MIMNHEENKYTFTFHRVHCNHEARLVHRHYKNHNHVENKVFFYSSWKQNIDLNASRKHPLVTLGNVFNYIQ